MVPYSTVLALLSLLMILTTGCTQKAPPRPGSMRSAQASGSPAPLNRRTENSDPIVKPTNAPPTSDSTAPLSTLLLDATAENEWKINLGGEDAAKLYHLMEVAPDKAQGSETFIKQGVQFVCAKSEEKVGSKVTPNFDCIFEAVKEDGEISVKLPISKVKKSVPEMAQTPEITTYLKIFDASEGKKVRIFIAGDNARRLYDSLDLPNTRRFDVGADKFNAPGVRRAGKHVNCFSVPLLTAPEVPLYSCYIHLDLAQGTVDKIDILNLQY